MQCLMVLAATVVGILAAAPGEAGVRIKLGLATIPGSFRYGTLHAATGEVTESTEPFRLGATAIQGEATGALGGGFEAGVELGGGIPFQRPALDHTVLFEPAAGGTNLYEGDSTVGLVTPVPLLAKIGWSGPAGPGTIGCTIGGGMMLVFVSSRSIDQWWDTPLGPNTNKFTAADTPYARVTAWRNDSLALPVIQAAPAYRLRLGGGHQVGLEVPVGFIGRRSLSGSRTEPLSLAPVTAAGDPVTALGGFVWNVLLVYTRTVD